MVARGFRNLVGVDLHLPEAGAVFLGPNGHGKTNLLELLYYPVLFRSVRGARDLDLITFGQDAFHLRVTVAREGLPDAQVEAGFAREGRRKRVAVDGAEQTRLTDALGAWLAVAFLPDDVRLVSGGASERRQYLDRVLSLTDRDYLRAARRYRTALEQRNAALRQGQATAAGAFEGALAVAGSRLIGHRLQWVADYGERWADATRELGEPLDVTLAYRGREELADPAAWPARFDQTRERDLVTGATTMGPHRDDLALSLGGRSLREIGSTGQQRTAAVALKLCERWTIAERAGVEPALLLDDVFAELDRDRQRRLAQALGAGRAPQVFVTAPRRDEVPEELDLPIIEVDEGQVRPAPEGVPR